MEGILRQYNVIFVKIMVMWNQIMSIIKERKVVLLKKMIKVTFLLFM